MPFILGKGMWSMRERSVSCTFFLKSDAGDCTYSSLTLSSSLAFQASGRTGRRSCESIHWQQTGLREPCRTTSASVPNVNEQFRGRSSTVSGISFHVSTVCRMRDQNCAMSLATVMVKGARSVSQ